MSCATCIHWLALDKVACGCTDDDGRPTFGHCRRHPPIIIEALIVGRLILPPAGHDLGNPKGVSQVIEEATRFPIIARHEGCGEHESEVRFPC